MDEVDREHRLERRVGRRILVGALVGTVLGAGLGLLVGAVVFAPWSAGHWAMALAGAILGGGIATVQGGLAGLEPQKPGAEPSTTHEPLSDRRLTSPEHGPEHGELHGASSPEARHREPDEG